jgi:hypothetical protein
MNEKYYSSYNVTANDGTVAYQKQKPTYDKELLWQNRMKYLGHKRSLNALYTCDIVLGIFAMMIAKGELSNLTINPFGAFSILLILAIVAASILTVTCLENPKTLIIAGIAFAAAGIVLSVLLGSFWYITIFILCAAQMGISLILSKNLEYLKDQFGYPYFSESIADSMMNKNN